MGTELTITKELANVSVTAAEWDAIARTVNALIPNPNFNNLFNHMVLELSQAYTLLLETLQPFTQLRTEADFTEHFDRLSASYKECYLHKVSQPRRFADETYEIYLALRQTKEIKTSYPTLKRTFQRLDEFIDKWVTNDAWIVMSIDNALKMMNRLLLELGELKKGDPEEAFLLFDIAMIEFSTQLNPLERNLEALAKHQPCTPKGSR